MKAVVKESSGKEGIRISNVELRDIKEDEVLVKVQFAGICGTDLHILMDEYPYIPSVIMGHEFSGEVVDFGAKCSKFKKDDRVVSLTATNTCDNCHYCHNGQWMLCDSRKSIGSFVNGAFAEYVILPEKNLFLVPENVSMQEAALTEPLACVVRCVIERGDIQPGDKVFVSGCGPIALLALQVAQSCGATCVVSGTSQDLEKFEVAKKLGAKRTINIQDEDELNKLMTEEKFDACLECAGAESSLATCLDVVRKQGNIIQLGLYGKKINVNLDLMLTKEVNYTNGFASEPTSWEISLKLLEQNMVKLEPLISRVFNLEDYNEAFDTALNKKDLKVLFAVE